MGCKISTNTHHQREWYKIIHHGQRCQDPKLIQNVPRCTLGTTVHWMSWVLLWRKHKRRTNKVGNTLGWQEVCTETICKNSNQFITSSPWNMEESESVYYISVHAYIGWWDAWVTTRYVQLQRSYNASKVQPSRWTYRGELVEETLEEIWGLKWAS